MTVQQFVDEYSVGLSRVLDDYLAKKLRDEDVQVFIDSVFSAWDRDAERKIEPMAVGEKELWCTVWATQHLATEDHWVDGVTQRELGILLKVLRGEESLPIGYEGRRP